MKTAVEWLLEQYVNKGIITIEDIEQANKMFEEQVIDAYDEAKVEGMCLTNNSEYWLSGEQYYNETFKTK
jgi:hypothetical protein